MPNYRISDHARFEMTRRGIREDLFESVMNSPQQIVPQREGHKVYQSKLDFGGGRTFLLRVVVIDDVDPNVVVTVYRTSKIDKYWKH